MENEKPTVEQILNKMRKGLNGNLPKSVELAAEVMPEMLFEQGRSKMFAMPEEGAIDNENRTLIYLGIAIATGSNTCIKTMVSKAKALNISDEKLKETYKIARYAEASRVFGNAEALFESLKK